MAGGNAAGRTGRVVVCGMAPRFARHAAFVIAPAQPRETPAQTGRVLSTRGGGAGLRPGLEHGRLGGSRKT